MDELDYTHLLPDGRRCYKLLTELSLLFGVIDVDLFEARIRYLNELASDYAPEVAAVTGEADVVVQTSQLEDSPSLDAKPAPSAHPGIVGLDQPTPPDWLQLIPSGKIARLKNWRFIKGDPDPYPSVPHGHDEGRSFPKLDPYLGHVYVSPTNTGRRLTKNDTRALWNDERFRDFAQSALLHFVQENPKFVWRVAYPLRIPRKH